MSDISNRTIVALLAVALVVSVAGTMYSVSELGDMGIVVRTISGLAGNDDGNVTLELQEVVSILVHNSDPGTLTGSVKAGQDKCIFSTGGVAAGGDDFGDSNGGTQFSGNDGANSDCDGNWGSASNRQSVFHLIENNGNVDANVTVKIASVNGAPGLGANLCSFLTGINDNNPASGCSDGTSSTLTNVTAVFEAIPNSVNSTGNASVRQHFDNVVTEDNRDDTRPSVGATTKVALDNSPKQLLGNFKSGNEEDEAAVAFHVIIPVDALPGSRTAELIYEAAKA